MIAKSWNEFVYKTECYSYLMKIVIQNCWKIDKLRKYNNKQGHTIPEILKKHVFPLTQNLADNIYIYIYKNKNICG